LRQLRDIVRVYLSEALWIYQASRTRAGGAADRTFCLLQCAAEAFGELARGLAEPRRGRAEVDVAERALELGPVLHGGFVTVWATVVGFEADSVGRRRSDTEWRCLGTRQRPRTLCALPAASSSSALANYAINFGTLQHNEAICLTVTCTATLTSLITSVKIDSDGTFRVLNAFFFFFFFFCV
jgi:hypothetical protein